VPRPLRSSDVCPWAAALPGPPVWHATSDPVRACSEAPADMGRTRTRKSALIREYCWRMCGPHYVSQTGFSGCGSFAPGVCAKGTAFAANFRRKTIKNWYEIVGLAAQMPARLMNPCRNRRAVGKRATEASRFLPRGHLIATSAQSSQSENLKSRAVGRMFVRGLEQRATAPRA
jgi:hypothetical protein